MYLLSQMWTYLLVAFGGGGVAGFALWRYCVRRSYDEQFTFAAESVRRDAEIQANAKLK